MNAKTMNDKLANELTRRGINVQRLPDPFDADEPAIVVVNDRAVSFDRWGYCDVSNELGWPEQQGADAIDQCTIDVAIAWLIDVSPRMITD
jgi:hypothetical protein